MSTQQCRVLARWKPIGKYVYKLPKFIYRVPCMLGNRVVEHLGAVKKRSDGRWNWWRFESKYHLTWKGESQGVADNQGTAEMRVLEGWEIIPAGKISPTGIVSIIQSFSGWAPLPTYILEWGEDMPPHILKALKDGEAALRIKDGKVHSMIVYNDIGGMREMYVTTMREYNQRSDV